MAPFSELGNVYCKLSGMVTEADWRSWSADDLLPYVKRVVGWFGEDRLMFGSDWPVCLLAGSYAQVVAVLLDTLRDILPESRAKIFGTNAICFYDLQLTHGL